MITNTEKTDDLEESACSNVTAFSYQFKDDLKITTAKKNGIDDADEDPDFDRNDLDDQDIQVGVRNGESPGQK